MTQARVFVSYRRGDSRHVAGRLADHLGWERDVRRVFFDTQSIPPGAPFPAAIVDGLRQATHTLVVIGPHWNGGTPPGQATPRLFAADDFVRREVEAALAGPGEVIPVLIDDAAMPGPNDVPPSLLPLLQRQAYAIHNDRRFADDLRPLITHLVGHEPRGADTAGSIALKSVAGAAAGALAFLLLSAVLQYLFGMTADRMFDAADPEGSRQLWSLVPYLFILAGAVAVPVIWRRWRLPRLRTAREP